MLLSVLTPVTEPEGDTDGDRESSSDPLWRTTVGDTRGVTLPLEDTLLEDVTDREPLDEPDVRGEIDTPEETDTDLETADEREADGLDVSLLEKLLTRDARAVGEPLSWRETEEVAELLVWPDWLGVSVAYEGIPVFEPFDERERADVCDDEGDFVDDGDAEVDGDARAERDTVTLADTLGVPVVVELTVGILFVAVAAALTERLSDGVSVVEIVVVITAVTERVGVAVNVDAVVLVVLLLGDPEMSGELEVESVAEVHEVELAEGDTDDDGESEEEPDRVVVGVAVDVIRGDRDGVTLCLLEALTLDEAVHVTAKGVRERVLD